jgi:hypothetical protein
MVSLVKKCEKDFLRKAPPLGYCLVSSAILKQAFVTLQRPPPDILTFDKTLSDFSNRITSDFGSDDCAVMAAINPAAPPPITAILI